MNPVRPLLTGFTSREQYLKTGMGKIYLKTRLKEKEV